MMSSTLTEGWVGWWWSTTVGKGRMEVNRFNGCWREVGYIYIYNNNNNIYNI